MADFYSPRLSMGESSGHCHRAAVFAKGLSQALSDTIQTCREHDGCICHAGPWLRGGCIEHGAIQYDSPAQHALPSNGAC